MAVTREAITHEGDTARVWVAVDDQALEHRQIKLGRAIGRLVLVPDGDLKSGERVITRGSLFIELIAVES